MGRGWDGCHQEPRGSFNLLYLPLAPGGLFVVTDLSKDFSVK